MNKFEIKSVAIDKLQINDTLLNLGSILEIEERDEDYWLVIDRMNERQVWRFNKTDILTII